MRQGRSSGSTSLRHGPDRQEWLLTASRELDVHMSADGANLDCQDCHVTEHHRIAAAPRQLDADKLHQRVGEGGEPGQHGGARVPAEVRPPSGVVEPVAHLTGRSARVVNACRLAMRK